MKKELQQLNDAQLVQEYRNGTSEAWDVLFSRHHVKMTRYIASIAGDDLAHDVMQDTWVVVITAILDGSYKEEQRFTKWIKGIAYRQAIKAWHEEHRFEYSDEGVPDNQDGALNAEQCIINKESETLLHQSLNRLVGSERQIVILRAWEERSFYEIAVIMHVSTNTARALYSRALNKMKKAVNRFH